MSRRFLFALIGLAATGALTLTAAPAGAIVIDGNLADWGVTVIDGTAGDTTPSNFSAPSPSGATLLISDQEDQSDLANHSGYVGPNYGGQDYDVEFAAAAISGTTLYMAFVSGLRPDNGFNFYSPGDIYIETGAGVFGIEVGGGAGGGAGGALQEGAAGSTYTMSSGGYTTGHSAAPAAQTTGSIWTDIAWMQDPIAPASDVQFTTDGGSTLVGTADFVFTRDSVTGQHSIIELALDISSLLGGMSASVLSFHWGPTCGNDVLWPETALTVHVAEPNPLALFGLGLVGLGFVRRRRARA